MNFYHLDSVRVSVADLSRSFEASVRRRKYASCAALGDGARRDVVERLQCQRFTSCLLCGAGMLKASERW